MHIQHLPGAPGGDTDPLFNAGELTPAEQAALDAKDDDTEASQREAAEQAERERLAAEQAAADAAAAAAKTEPPPVVQQLTDPGEAPAPPKDFDAELAALNEKVRSGLLDPVDYADGREALQAERAAFNATLTAHEQAVAAFQQAQQAQVEASKKIETDWAADYNTFAKENAEFMGNALYVRDMQTVMDDLLRTNPAISNADLLNEAYKKVAEYHRYEKPAVADPLAQALRDRQQTPPGATLGDAPQARAETITGNETFDRLDRLSTLEHEDVYAAMTPAQQEAYLKSAPGANSTGRD